VGLALGAQAGEQRLRDVVTGGGFTRFQRATETPFNLMLEARPVTPASQARFLCWDEGGEPRFTSWDRREAGSPDAEHTALLLPGGICTAAFYEELMAELTLMGLRGRARGIQAGV
jgi:hypothetical protein